MLRRNSFVKVVVHEAGNLTGTNISPSSSAAKFLHQKAMQLPETGKGGHSNSRDALRTPTQQPLRQEGTNNSLPKEQKNLKSPVQNANEIQIVKNLVQQKKEHLSPEMWKCIDNAHSIVFGHKQIKDAFANAPREFSTSTCALSDMRFPKDGESHFNEVAEQSQKNLVHAQDQNPIIPDQETFKEYVWQCGKEFYSTDKSLEPERLEVAWTMYQQGLKGSKLGFAVIGRQPLRGFDSKTQEEIIIPSNEEYPSLDREVGKNFGFMNQSENGSLLLVKNVNSLVMNDAWMLGTIQRPWALEKDHVSTSVISSDGSTQDLKPDLSLRKSPEDFVKFHFGAPLRWENFWKEKSAGENSRMTILAREIIQLVESGYEIIRPNPKLEPVAVCVDPEKARNASLLKYKEAVEKYWDREALKAFFESLPKEVRE